MNKLNNNEFFEFSFFLSCTEIPPPIIKRKIKILPFLSSTHCLSPQNNVGVLISFSYSI